MRRILFAAIAAFVLSLLAGPFAVFDLRRRANSGKIYESGPQSHLGKQGTPIMGGVIFLGGMLLMPLVFHIPGSGWRNTVPVLLSTLGFAAIGFADDWIKVHKHRAEGLTPMQKIVPQVALALVFGVWGYMIAGSKLILPFFNAEWDLGIFYIPVMAFIYVAVVNSANLLDGCDGLLAGCAMIDFACLAFVFAILGGYGDLVVIAACCAGALLGFLFFNVYPAKIFMGDSGSFAIGGALAAAAMCSRLSLLLPLICLAMVVASLSDMAQIVYCRYHQGRRLFLMTPLQHHFEESGMPETHVVNMYWAVTLILCLLGVIGFVK